MLFSLSILYAKIRFFESILHLAYKLPVKRKYRPGFVMKRLINRYAKSKFQKYQWRQQQQKILWGGKTSLSHISCSYLFLFRGKFSKWMCKWETGYVWNNRYTKKSSIAMNVMKNKFNSGWILTMKITGTKLCRIAKF